MSSNIELTPHAHLLMSSLRSVGYKAETAIADIIDNCIGAHATEIHVDFVWNGAESCIAIYDNGVGMSKDCLVASMKIGSADPAMLRDSSDLGRFGMGMKTAAFSLGKRLRVITKKEWKLSSACWDLEYIANSHDGKWTLLVDDNDASKISQDYGAFSNFANGTIVLIEDLDRFVDVASLKKSQTNFYKVAERVKEHIGMIFHRFIEDDGLAIFFKDELIAAWNPFIIANSATQELSEEEYIDDNTIVTVQPYVLPHKTKFDSQADFEAAAGPKGWTAQQGIYVYRNRRLLVYGTWFDFIKKEPAYNLARIKLDMNADADFDWKIDIKKSVATPPLYMRDILDRAITMCTIQSAKVYNSRGSYSKSPGSQQLSFVWEQRKNRQGTYQFCLNKKHPMLEKIMSQLNDEGKSDIKAYLALVENYAPTAQSGLTSYLSASPKNEVAENDPARLADIAEAKEYIQKFFQSGFAKEEIESIILGMPNYSYIAEELKKIFEDECYD